MTRNATVAAGAAVLALLASCGRAVTGDATPPRGALPPEGVMAAVPLGDVAGAANDTLKQHIANPYAHDPRALQEGQRLFGQMNCAGCHGYDATGGMGPDLTDPFWRYGGTAAEIYKSIYEGRPKGMPAWGDKLPPADIWRLVTYIQSLGGAEKHGQPVAPVGSQDDGPASRTMKGRHGSAEH